MHATITWLLTTYGRVTYSEVIDEQAVLAKYPVQVHITLTDFFNKIDDHLPRATAAGVSLSEHQVIALARQTIKKNADFRQAVLAWNARTQQPTWLSFKQFPTESKNTSGADKRRIRIRIILSCTARV